MPTRQFPEWPGRAAAFHDAKPPTLHASLDAEVRPAAAALHQRPAEMAGRQLARRSPTAQTATRNTADHDGQRRQAPDDGGDRLDAAAQPRESPPGETEPLESRLARALDAEEGA